MAGIEFGPNDRIVVDPNWRQHYKGGFTKVETDAFDDPRLSLDGFGILCFIRYQQQRHGRPDDWEPTMEDLTAQFVDSAEHLAEVLLELRRLGYIGPGAAVP